MFDTEVLAQVFLPHFISPGRPYHVKFARSAKINTLRSTGGLLFIGGWISFYLRKSNI